MPRISKNGNVAKRCGCVRWKECKHSPWWVVAKDGTRRLRRPLYELVGREPKDFEDAKTEAARAVLAWKEGKDATDLLPMDAPTVTAVLDAYAEKVTPIRRAKMIATVVNGRPLGEYRAADLTRAMIETFRRARPKVAGNRDLAVLRAALRWAVAEELIPSTPFAIAGVPVVRLAREESRSRRLYPGEEIRLMAGADPYLKDLIRAALETACRRGELLSLQWSQVEADALFLPAGKTKTKKPRRVPINAALRLVLDARRNDPFGNPFQPEAYVFGDEIGRRRKDIKTAWNAARRRAKIPTTRPPADVLAATDGPKPEPVAGLRFHDLRREAASRWMDGGVPLATIQKWLGHANLAQTSTYLAAPISGDQDAMKAYDAVRAKQQRDAAKKGNPGGSMSSVAYSGGSSVAYCGLSSEPTGRKRGRTNLVPFKKPSKNADGR